MSGFIYYVEILLATYAALIVGLYTLSLRIPAAAFLARILASYAALIIASGYGVFISICFRFVGFQRSGQWATGRCFKYAMQLGTGVTFKIEDPHNYLNTIRPAVFVGNHQTELDVLMLGCMFPKYCAVAAKSSLRKVPILGWFMSLSGTVFINRTDPKDARAAMAGAAKEMTSKRQSVYMFPEGTRSYSKEPMLLPFKKGAFHLAVQAGVPIVPVVAANYSDVLYVKDWKFRSGVIAVKVLKPIETKGLTTADVEDLTRNTRNLMLKEIIELTSRARGQPMKVPSGGSDGVVKASGLEATITS